MRPARLTIARVMTVVAALAVNLAAIRAALTHGETPLFGESTTLFEMTLMFGPTALVAEFGLARAIVGGPVRRPFWVGLAVSSAVVAMVLLGAGLADLPVIWPLWMGYLEGFETLAAKFPALARAVTSDFASHAVALSLYQSAPQVALAALGGAAVALVSGAVRRRRGAPAGAGPTKLAPRRTRSAEAASGRS